jgi:hypothetical protein
MVTPERSALNADELYDGSKGPLSVYGSASTLYDSVNVPASQRWLVALLAMLKAPELARKSASWPPWFCVQQVAGG